MGGAKAVVCLNAFKVLFCFNLDSLNARLKKRKKKKKEKDRERKVA